MFRPGRLLLVASVVVAWVSGTGCAAAASETQLGFIHAARSNVTGCGPKEPTYFPLNSRFDGVKAIARNGVTYSTVFDKFKYDMYPVWCITGLGVFRHPVWIEAQFFTKASTADVQRFAAFLDRMGLFAKVEIVKNRSYY